MEVIVTLSETAPAMVRKFGKYMPLLGKKACFVNGDKIVWIMY
jgi:hypothetical protein